MRMVKNAVLCTTITFTLFALVVTALVALDIIGLYRVNYSADYGAYALTFGLGTYVPLYSLPVPAIFLATLVFGFFMGIERKLSAEEILEYTGGIAMLSAIAFFIGGMIATLATGPPSTLSRIIFVNGMGGAMVGLVVGMFSITTCVTLETLRNRCRKRMLKERREA